MKELNGLRGKLAPHADNPKEAVHAPSLSLREWCANSLGAEGARWFFVACALLAALALALIFETGKVHDRSARNGGRSGFSFITAAHAAEVSGFSFRGALVRVITPNGDLFNPNAILCFENPKSSGVRGVIYDIRGREVSGMTHLPNSGGGGGTIAACEGTFPPGSAVPNSTEALTWDGKSAGSPVQAGVYIYQIESEDVTVTGTVVVVR